MSFLLMIRMVDLVIFFLPPEFARIF